MPDDHYSADEMDALAEIVTLANLETGDYCDADIDAVGPSLREGAEAKRMVARVQAEIARCREIAATSGKGGPRRKAAGERADDLERLLLGTEGKQ